MKNTQSADTVPVHRHSPLVGVLEGASVLDLLCPKFTIESPDGILNPYSHKVFLLEVETSNLDLHQICT